MNYNFLLWWIKHGNEMTYWEGKVCRVAVFCQKGQDRNEDATDEDNNHKHYECYRQRT